MQRHYDACAKTSFQPGEVLSERRKGGAYPLKKFHNAVKRALIERFARGASRLLDLACGRGGDLQKWRDAGIGYVKGVDISPREIEEARERCANLEMPMPVDFEVHADLGRHAAADPTPYDAVTCMFAMHYFYESENVLDTFLRHVSANLKDGGYFLGCVPDGKRIAGLLRNRATFTSPYLTVTRHWSGPMRTFGCGYTFALQDTVTQGNDVSSGSYEFLVFFKAFTLIAARHGMHPIVDYDLGGMVACSNDAFKHFQPPPGLDPDLARVSELFAAFAFQKRLKT